MMKYPKNSREFKSRIIDEFHTLWDPEDIIETPYMSVSDIA